MATFGPIASAAPNVLFSPMAVDQAVQQSQRNRLMIDSARQDQTYQNFDRDRPEVVDPHTDQMVRTVLGEAGGEGPQGQQAVAHVVLNRARQSGQSTDQVIFAPNQFEPWNNPQTRARLEGIDPRSPEYQQALEQ